MPNAERGPSANDGLTFDSFRAPRSALVMYSRTAVLGNLLTVSLAFILSANSLTWDVGFTVERLQSF